MSVGVKLTKNFSGMVNLSKALRSAATGQGGFSGPFGAMYKQWAVRYSAFVRKRFNTYSRGGGDWEPLKDSTKKGRRKGKGSGNAAILKDTGTLFGALTIGSRGNLTDRISAGVEFGFGGSDRHPDGTMTVKRLAEIHQKGSSRRNIPARPIIVMPDARTNRGMMSDMERAFKRRWMTGTEK